MNYMGIDIGSTYVKTVIIDDSKEILYKNMRLTGWNSVTTANELYEEIKELPFYSPELFITATGYGRNSVAYAARTMTEITCHAIGAREIFDSERALIIDVGGQDTKVVSMVDGFVNDFVMNDKCAAGTGRFLEVMAGSLNMTTDEMCELAKEGSGIEINSLCAVFAESEVIGLIGKGTPKEDIAFGIVDSIARKVKTQCSKMRRGNEKIFLTGGLSDNKVFLELLSKRMSASIVSNELGRYAGALGAALVGME